MQEYERLFRDAHPEQRRLGEASVWYLFSETAVPKILEYAEDPRFIVCLRNPVEMAYSLHEQWLVSGQEHIRDFETAWRHSSDRMAGAVVNRHCQEPRMLAYAEVCALGSQLARLYENAPRDSVLPVLLDDLHSNPRMVYLKILRFLDVGDDGRQEFPALNQAKVLKSKALRQVVLWAGNVKRRLGIRRSLGVESAFARWNTRPAKRVDLPSALRSELENHFYLEVEHLEDLLGRDLGGWMR